MSAVIYVVDDHLASAEALMEALEDEGYGGRCFPTAALALEEIRNAPPDLVLSDLRMDGMDGLELLKAIHLMDSDIPVIIMTAYASIEKAIEATQAGAFAFATKPIKLAELQIQVRNALALHTLTQANKSLQAVPNDIVGGSAPLLEALARVDRAAATRMTVLLRGESGTGKELFARRLHQLSDRKEQAFIPVNCGAIPDSLIESELFGSKKGAFTGSNTDRIGLIESAHEGTLFLDEVGELTADAQTRLLRFLQEGTIRRVGDNRDRNVDVRVIAASHRNLTGEGFRQDLYYRLNVIPIELPPLRQRGEDVLLLFARALRKTCQELGRELPALGSEVISALQAYRWPGNVRELINVADRLAVLTTASTLGLNDLPREIVSAIKEPDSISLPKGNFDLTAWLENLEERALSKALSNHDGIKARAAASLGLERNAFRYKLKKYGLDA